MPKEKTLVEKIKQHLDEKPLAKVPFTVFVPLDVINDIRTAALHLSGLPHRLTLSSIIESAIRRELVRLQKVYNSGNPFTPVEGASLRPGRPLK
jgi:hypothetical protein